jgi:hypothetical protein
MIGAFKRLNLNLLSCYLSAQGDEFFTHLIDFVSVCRDTTMVRLADRQCQTTAAE